MLILEQIKETNFNNGIVSKNSILSIATIYLHKQRVLNEVHVYDLTRRFKAPM